MKKEKKQPRSIGRADLEKRLRNKGFSKREARRTVNGILEGMIQALQRGEEVEFPLGKLKREPHRRRQQEGNFLGRRTTIYRRRSTVVHEMDEKGDKLLNPRPRPRFALPPKPLVKTEEKKTQRKITMRGMKKTVPAPQPVEPSQEKPRPRFVLPPRPKPWDKSGQ